jgi:hypothetical protein
MTARPNPKTAMTSLIKFHHPTINTYPYFFVLDKDGKLLQAQRTGLIDGLEAPGVVDAIRSSYRECGTSCTIRRRRRGECAFRSFALRQLLCRCLSLHRVWDRISSRADTGLRAKGQAETGSSYLTRYDKKHVLKKFPFFHRSFRSSAENLNLPPKIRKFRRTFRFSAEFASTSAELLDFRWKIWIFDRSFRFSAELFHLRWNFRFFR